MRGTDDENVQDEPFKNIYLTGITNKIIKIWFIGMADIDI